jgi:hypothetical protein
MLRLYTVMNNGLCDTHSDYRSQLQVFDSSTHSRSRSTSSSSEQLWKGPHDEPGIDVILQELYVCSSADHGVQVPSLGRLVEYNVTTHEYPCFRCWCPDLVQAIIQHLSEHLPTL